MPRPAAPAPAPSRWLAGPVLDLLIGCGAWTLPLLAATWYLGTSAIISASLLFYALTIFCNNPHYMATLHRAYGTPEDFSRYRFFTVYVTALMLVLVGLLLAVPRLLPFVFTAYLLWSPWHYSGQNFGIALLLGRRAGVQPTRAERNLLLAFFWLSFFVWILSMQTATAAAAGNAYLLSLGLPNEQLALPRTLLLAAALAMAAAAAVRLVLRYGVLACLAVLVLLSTQILWFVMPTFLELGTGATLPPIYFSTGALAFMHCAQYLWVTHYFARRSGQAAGAAGAGPAAPRGGAQFWRYYGVQVLGGIALFVPAPWLVSRTLGRDFFETFLLFTALINLHHFILDGAIWKLRDGRIARLLLGSSGGGVAAPGPLAPPAGTLPSCAVAWQRAAQLISGRGLVPRTIQVGLVVLLVGLAVADQVQFYSTMEGASAERLRLAEMLNPTDSRVYVQRAVSLSQRGDREGAIRELRRAIELNPRSQAQYLLGTLYVQGGDFEQAARHYQQQAALVKPDFTTYMNVGALAGRAGNQPQALENLRRACGLEPENAEARLNYAEALSATGQGAAAAAQYRLALELALSRLAQAGVPPAEQVKLGRGALRASLRLATLAVELGQPQLARDSLRQAAPIAARLSDAAWQAQAAALLRALQ